jgi:dihydroorotate dehydrogenase electron transfer subunit
MQHLQAKIIHNRPEQKDYRVLELHAPHVAEHARPGQFVHVRVACDNDPLLRRPISIMSADRHTGLIRLLIKKVGRGTEIMSELPEGAMLDLLGPLGNGFTLPPEGKDVLLIGGGVGIAPLVFFADLLQTSPGERRARGLMGGANEDQLPVWTEFAGRCEEFYVTTDDGSAGEQGLVTDLLPAQIARGDLQAVYTCGPRPMMAKVAAMCAEAKLPCYASLEQWMGCGVGACLGCVVPGTKVDYLRVCRDGPVFEAGEVDWTGMTAMSSPTTTPAAETTTANDEDEGHCCGSCGCGGEDDD